jgi:hypothetical protein
MQLVSKFLPGDHRCLCGSLLEHGMRPCRKWRARSRWRRRKTGRPRSAISRLPANRHARRRR